MCVGGGEGGGGMWPGKTQEVRWLGQGGTYQSSANQSSAKYRAATNLPATKNKWQILDQEVYEFGTKSYEALSWKMRARTHYFRGREHPSFWGLEHSLFRRARALIIQEGTSTHHSKTTKQRTNEPMQNGHERNKVPEVLFWKNEGAHPLFLRARAPIFLRARALII